MNSVIEGESGNDTATHNKDFSDADSVRSNMHVMEKRHDQCRYRTESQ